MPLTYQVLPERVQSGLVKVIKLSSGTLPQHPVLVQCRLDAPSLVGGQRGFKAPLRTNRRRCFAECNVQCRTPQAVVVSRPVAIFHPYDGDPLVWEQGEICPVARVAT